MAHVNREERGDGGIREIGPQEENYGHKSRLRIYFEVRVEDGVLRAFHEKGIQLIDFSENDNAPKLLEVLAALEAGGMDMSRISGLHNAGIKKMMLYPVDETKPLLATDRIFVKGLVGRVFEAPPIERMVGPKLVEVHFHGLPKKNQHL
ncbi:hypothetical protein ACJMK2_020795 [Sinanodonta woodiana]|uniref:Uncharacterized protein n=1 Tax=Sinanodonta woodiana TaxID=1069815 RepID=A0ABD3U0A1_SINWO